MSMQNIIVPELEMPTSDLTHFRHPSPTSWILSISGVVASPERSAFTRVVVPKILKALVHLVPIESARFTVMFIELLLRLMPAIRLS